MYTFPSAVGAPLEVGATSTCLFCLLAKPALVSERSETSPYAIQNCHTDAMKQSFNNIGYATLGYNILRGYPLAHGMDPGFSAPIFKADYSTMKVSADCRYSLPEGFHVYPQVACETSFSSEEIKSKKEFEESFSASVHASAVGWGAKFSANAGYAKTSSKVQTGESLLILSQAECRYYKSRLDLKSPPQLDEKFIQHVTQLQSAADKEEAVHDLFDTYGTHFITELDFGAHYTKQHEMTYSQYEKASSSKFNVGVQASYSGVVDVGGGFSLDSEQRQAAMDFQKSVKTTTLTVGATPPASGDEMEWASNVKLDPMPVGYKLESIEELFTPQFMPGVQNHADLKRAIEQHKGTYCSKLSRRLGVEDTCSVTHSGRSSKSHKILYVAYSLFTMFNLPSACIC